MAVTALGEKLQAAGFVPREARLSIAIAEFQNNGGTLERLIELARTAYELPGEAMSRLPKGQGSYASARQPDGDEEGHVPRAEQASVPMPFSSPIRGETIVRHAFRNQRGHFLRTPSTAQLRVAAAVAKDAAVTVLDTYKIRDGRPIGDIRIGELEGLRTANAMEASLIRQIQRHAAADSSARVRDVVNVHDLQRMIQRAAEVADAT